jgi:hypothetical protein
MRSASLIVLASLLAGAATVMPAAAAAPDNTGTWTGKASQVGRDRTYTVIITIGKKEVTSAYPDQNCTGKLTRTGSSGSYAFYAEAIVNNKFDATKKKGCLDGAVTLLRTGNSLIYSWIGAFNDKPIVAYATLALTAAAAPPNPPTPAPAKTATKH